MQQQINGVSLRYSLYGPTDAPVLTLGHALSLDMRSWAPQIAAFRDRYRVLCLDFRGHAKTDVDGPPFSIEDLADDVVGLLDYLNIARAHFVGSSIGGMAGYALARHYADRLASLTLVATQGILPEERVKMLREGIAAMRADGVGLETRVDPMLKRLLRDGYEAENPENYAKLRNMVTGGTVEGYAGACEAIAEMDFDDRLAEITAPTLVIAGALDVATTPERMAIYRDDIPDSRMSVMENTGHFPNVESPDEFNAILDAFLAEQSP